MVESGGGTKFFWLKQYTVTFAYNYFFVYLVKYFYGIRNNEKDSGARAG